MSMGIVLLFFYIVQERERAVGEPSQGGQQPQGWQPHLSYSIPTGASSLTATSEDCGSRFKVLACTSRLRSTLQ